MTAAVKAPKRRGGKHNTRPKMPVTDRPLLSGTVVARMLGMDIPRVYRAMVSGEIPSIKIGDRYLVSRVVLDRIIAGE